VGSAHLAVSGTLVPGQWDMNVPLPPHWGSQIPMGSGTGHPFLYGIPVSRFRGDASAGSPRVLRGGTGHANLGYVGRWSVRRALIDAGFRDGC